MCTNGSHRPADPHNPKPLLLSLHLMVMLGMWQTNSKWRIASLSQVSDDQNAFNSCHCTKADCQHINHEAWQRGDAQCSQDIFEPWLLHCSIDVSAELWRS